MTAPAERVVIPHIDDVGMCHGANQAYFDLYNKGFITTASVMVPCAWFPEVAERVRTDRSFDLGVHLTLTSEWRHYRWRPIAGGGRRSGLVDDDGFMWRTVIQLRQNVDPTAAEDEMRAQIETALAAGVDATHLDTHMAAAAIPELVGIYLRLGQEYRLPVLLPRNQRSYFDLFKHGAVPAGSYGPWLKQLEDGGAQFIDTFRMTPGVPSVESDAAYRALVQTMPSGTTFFSVHCNAPGDIETIVPDRAHWRTDEYRIFADPDFLAVVAASGVRLAGFKELRAKLRAA